MKLIKSLSAAVLAMTALTTNVYADAVAIEAVNQEIEDAIAAGSAERFTAIYTSDAQLLPPNSPIVEGSEEILKFWQIALKSGVTSAQLETLELTHDDKTAVEIGTYVMKLADGSLADEGKYMIHWKVEDGAWKYHRDMWSSNLNASK